jgi:hypothetical protein
MVTRCLGDLQICTQKKFPFNVLPITTLLVESGTAWESIYGARKSRIHLLLVCDDKVSKPGKRWVVAQDSSAVKFCTVRRWVQAECEQNVCSRC